MRRTKLYGIWTAILRRCRNPNAVDYPRYGGRGITVCDRWERSFLAFYNDMGEPEPGQQIDRIDNAGPYSPENCRWVSASKNCRNRRSSSFVEYKGEKVTIAELSERSGIGVPTLLWRMKKMGMSADEAATVPKQIRGDLAPGAKLTEVDVRRAFDLRLQGMTHQAIAKELGVSSPTITEVLTRKTWAHLADLPDVSHIRGSRWKK